LHCARAHTHPLPNGPGRGRHGLWKAPLVLAAVLFTGAELLRLAPQMYPVREGDPAVFWMHACWLDVGVKSASPGGGIYQPRDGWFIYYRQGFHERFLYRVKAAEALGLFPPVVRRLEGAPPGALAPDVETGARAWLQADPTRTDASRLLREVWQAELARLRQTDRELYEFVRDEEDAFSERWERTQHYHRNLAFEFLFLTGVILFAAWPWLRGSGRWAWAVHLGLIPVLFFLPLWLGYAQYTFTSRGPSGGVLYPWLVLNAPRLPWTGLDTVLVRNLPPLLEPISQTPGPMLSLTRFGFPVGPVAAVLLGAAVAGSILGFRVGRRRLEGWLAAWAATQAPRRRQKGRLASGPEAR
jgi:hypothetical protein